jgi:hypothetical protein
MSLAVQLDEDAYAVAMAYAKKEHCSIGRAVSKLVLNSKMGVGKEASSTPVVDIHFPLVRGSKPITPEDVASLEDEG